jgi:hypothetical protein
MPEPLPATLVLSDEAVDRLRAAVARSIMDSPEFQRLLVRIRARIAERPSPQSTDQTSKP